MDYVVLVASLFKFFHVRYQYSNILFQLRVISCVYQEHFSNEMDKCNVFMLPCQPTRGLPLGTSTMIVYRLVARAWRQPRTCHAENPLSRR